MVTPCTAATEPVAEKLFSQCPSVAGVAVTVVGGISMAAAAAPMALNCEIFTRKSGPAMRSAKPARLATNSSVFLSMGTEDEVGTSEQGRSIQPAPNRQESPS